MAADPMDAAACATTTLKVGCLVYCNNFRHPTLLAREAATVDVLSEGRLEFGIGAGYYLPEYSQTGIGLPPAHARVERLQEALTVIKGLWSSGPLTFGGKHYTTTDMEGWPKPIQQPHPPIQVGGGGKRMLGLAAQSDAADSQSGPSQSDVLHGGHDPYTSFATVMADMARGQPA